jgi:non-homologous end joining protein Ku
VIDLMDALKQSLEKRTTKSGGKEEPAKKPAAKARPAAVAGAAKTRKTGTRS